jgi:hypothetical protein
LATSWKSALSLSAVESLSASVRELADTKQAELAGIKDLKSLRMAHVIDFFHRIYHPFR